MMNNNSIIQPAPPFVLAGGLILWGWQNEKFLPFAILMALILESSRIVKWRWTTPEKEFNNIADLSGVVFFITVVYIVINTRSQAIYTILSILPFVVFPITLTQIFSVQGSLKLSVLLISMRKLDPAQSAELNKNIDISLPYFIICVISASSGNLRTPWFYILVCLLLGYILWKMRPRRYPGFIWLLVFCSAVVLGYATQEGIRNAQMAIERSLMSVFDQFMWRYRDPNRATTAIGSLGRLKLSDRVLIRVKTERPLTDPLYLDEAAYDSYKYGIWSNTTPAFTLIDPDTGGDGWTLNQIAADRTADISTYMTRDTGVIPVPHGTGKIKGTGIIEINQNDKGTVRMEIRRGWIKYRTVYKNMQSPGWLPTENDLMVADTYKDDFLQLAEELSLQDKTDSEKIASIKRHFEDNFLYSLTRQRTYPRGRYLHNFLFEDQQGHCEFFATSTVLLLRTIGIPARYAVGYYISEYSNLEGQYVGRSRHAHSWALAYVDDDWQIVDTTPSTWAPYEEENASGFQGLFDLGAWLRYKLSRWQARDELEEEEQGELNLLWLLIPLTLILAWRLYIRERILTHRNNRNLRTSFKASGLDSEFFKLAALIEQKGFKRREGETTADWIERTGDVLAVSRLNQALKLHYQYRFDPRGISRQAREQLQSLVQEITMELDKVTVRSEA